MEPGAGGWMGGEAWVLKTGEEAGRGGECHKGVAGVGWTAVSSLLTIKAGRTFNAVWSSFSPGLFLAGSAVCCVELSSICCYLDGMALSSRQAAGAAATHRRVKEREQKRERELGKGGGGVQDKVRLKK